MRKQHIALLLVFWASLSHGDVPLTSKEFGALKDKFNKEQNPVVKANQALKLGVEAYTAKDLVSSAGYLNQVLTLNSKLDDYAQFHLGLIARDNKDWTTAKKNFQSVIMHFPTSVLKIDAQNELVQIAKTEEKWAESSRILNQIVESKSSKYWSKKRRRWIRRDGSDKLPAEIVYALFETNAALKHTQAACGYARKLYVKHASFSLLKGWGFEIPQVKNSAVTFNCSVGVEDHKKRFATLLRNGEYDEIIKELYDWELKIKAGKAPKTDQAQIEIFSGRVALALGKIEAAVKHYHTAQDMLGRNYNLHLLLGKAYSETENYAAAIESYLNAYNSAGKVKDKTYALFMASFSSYQNRDYDGAARRFEELVKRWPTSKYVSDAKWHMAWIRYLKTDYEGALKEFEHLSRTKYKRDYDMLQKLKYWQAMSEFRLGNIEAARQTFNELADPKNSISYYGAAASARLASLPLPSARPAGPSFIAPPSPTPSGPSLIAPPGSASNTKPVRKVAQADLEGVALGDGSGEAELDKSVPDTVEAAEENDDDKKEEKSAEADADDETDVVDAEIPVSTFKDPALAARFDRVRELISLGFRDWARREMQLIQSSTRNSEFREMLMVEYKNAGDYHRSKQISDDYFKAKRKEKGMDAGRKYWEAAYPLAYEKTVMKWCTAYSVFPAFAWGIMRGESEYREEVKSPAGAMGLMQIMLNTARKVAKLIPYEQEFKDHFLLMPDVNIRLGIWYLKRIENTLDSSLKIDKQTTLKLPLMASSYNAGPHRTLAWLKDFGGLDTDEFIEHIPFKETRHYVKKVLTNYLIYQMLYKKEPNPLSWITKPTIKYEGPKPSTESWN
ncbi:MAG: transglycosylase SLT domain-containing protein [Oligoflexia bacterium]|nr:transglycosylase SLT domain-containing protein [Oligoflexia bacterium]